jgi:3-hydroxyisobutyrate dehydrogenase-like beta-hydroxyacid dehydrogenase
MGVIAESAVGSPLVQYKRNMVVSGDYAPAFSVAQMLKDFDLIAGAAEVAGCDMPLIAGVRERYRAAIARGLADRDFFVLAANDD